MFKLSYMKDVLKRKFVALSRVLVISLLASVGPASSDEAVKNRDQEAARCNLLGANTNVQVFTHLEGDSAAGLVSKVYVNSDYTGKTDVEGFCNMEMDTCSSAEMIEVSPISPNYCGEISECQYDLEFHIEVGCESVAALLDDREPRFPWAPTLIVALTNQVGELVRQENLGLAEEFSKSVSPPYNSGNFYAASVSARDFVVDFLVADERAASFVAEVVALDAGFRAMGLEPGSDDKPLIEVGEEGFVPSDLGWQILSYTQSGELNRTVPVVFPQETIDALLSEGFRNRPIIHPDKVGDLRSYISGF